ncbi:MAG TPA: AbgT family transporter [Bacteroidales bacterium]|nr:AbgT family transporter [Bacteroidales bacterium]
MHSPRRPLTFMVVFTGILSNMASDVGYVLLIPLAGVIFLAVGRHPLAGMAAAFAGVSGGFSANLFLGTIDPLLAGLSEEAAHIPDPGYHVNPTANYYFMAASTFIIAFVGTLVTERLVEPRLGVYTGPAVEDGHGMHPPDRRERQGLWIRHRSIQERLDVMNGIAAPMKTLATYLVLVFFAAQFWAWFKWSNLGITWAIPLNSPRWPSVSATA